MTAPTPDDEPAGGRYTVEELAAALQQDPVIVQQIMGNGSTEAVDDALTELAEETGLPVYVALVDSPPGLAEDAPADDLVSRLHAAVGEDGVYVVGVDPEVGHVRWEGYGAGIPREGDLYGVNPFPDHDDPALPDQSAAGTVAEVLATLGNDLEPLPGQVLEAYRTGSVWARPGTGAADQVDAPTDGTYAVVATGVGVGLAVLAWFVLRTLARWRELAPATRTAPGAASARAPETARAPTGKAPPARPQPPTVEAVRRRAQDELTELARAVERATRAGRPGGPAAHQLVDGSRTTAECLLETAATAPRGDEPLLDALGALVLVRTARRALAQPAEPTYRPCFFNPWHGAATAEVAAPVGRDDRVDLPVCEGCREGSGRAELRDPLEVASRRGRRPYWEDDSVWARTGFGAIADDLWRAVLDDRRNR